MTDKPTAKQVAKNLLHLEQYDWPHLSVAVCGKPRCAERSSSGWWSCWTRRASAMPSIDERREVAKLLRGMSEDTAGLSDGEFIDLVTEIVRGVDVPASQDPDAAFLNRLADLIDPTEHERAEISKEAGRWDAT